MTDDPVPGHGVPGARLRLGAPRRGPLERRGDPVEGGDRRRGARLRRRPRARPRRPHRLGHLRRGAGRRRSTCPTAASSTTTTTATSSTGWAACAPTSMRHHRPTSCWSILGDWNIAPADDDVWKPEAFDGCTHVSAPEREALARVKEWGLVDTFRERYPEPGIYSYWDYRNGDFHKKRGMRIDYLLSSTALATTCRADLIDRNARKGTKPSDHAPVLALVRPLSASIRERPRPRRPTATGADEPTTPVPPRIEGARRASRPTPRRARGASARGRHARGDRARWCRPPRHRASSPPRPTSSRRSPRCCGALPGGQTYQGFAEAANAGAALAGRCRPRAATPSGSRSSTTARSSGWPTRCRRRCTSSTHGDRVTARSRFGSAYEGPPGCVHGGYVAAAFDELLGAAQSLSGTQGMTADLEVDYRTPTPLRSAARAGGRGSTAARAARSTGVGRMCAGRARCAPRPRACSSPSTPRSSRSCSRNLGEQRLDAVTTVGSCFVGDDARAGRRRSAGP